MPVSMFTTKTDSVNASATSAHSPSATTIATIAITSGTRPATTVPNTRIRTTSAAGRPMRNSPDLRSCWERRLKSWSSVPSPVITTEKPSRPFFALDHAQKPIDVLLPLNGDQRRMPIAGNERSIVPVVVGRGVVDDAGLVALPHDAPHESPEG